MSKASPELHCVLDSGLFSKNLNLQPGAWIKLVGNIPPHAKHFSVNLGKDEGDIALHFNARFNFAGDKNCIIYNHCTNCKWGKLNRDTHFPFVTDSTIEVSITFAGNHFDVKMPNGYKFTYPNHLNIAKIDFISTTGDIKLKMLSIHMDL